MIDADRWYVSFHEDGTVNGRIVDRVRLLGWRHSLFDALRLLGLRDRLRCPRCLAVGTWKPHGGRLDYQDTRKVRRWLCKWCGLYVGPEGVLEASVSKADGCWSLKGTDGTPQSRCTDLAYPWRG